jgi:hypothetical protein
VSCRHCKLSWPPTLTTTCSPFGHCALEGRVRARGDVQLLARADLGIRVGGLIALAAALALAGTRSNTFFFGAELHANAGAVAGVGAALSESVLCGQQVDIAVCLQGHVATGLQGAATNGDDGGTRQS